MSKILAYHFHAVDYVFSQKHEMEICKDPLLILPSIKSNHYEFQLLSNKVMK